MRLIDVEPLECVVSITPKGVDAKSYNEGYKDALELMDKQPTIAAVPLEMISKKLGSLCKPCIFHIGCPYKSFDCDSCNTSDAWEKTIIKWMEGSDAD